MKLLSVKGFVLVVPLFALLSSLSFASGGVKGGDPVEQDFVEMAKAGVVQIRVRAADFPEVNIKLLEAKIKAVSPTATDDPVYDSEGHLKACTNDFSTGVISVNRDRWKKIKDVKRKVGLSVHEYLGLLQLDRHYEISSRLTGLSPNYLANGRLGLIKENGWYCWEHYDDASKSQVKDCSDGNSHLVTAVDMDNLKVYFREGNFFSCDSDDAQNCRTPGGSWILNVLPDGRIGIYGASAGNLPPIMFGTNTSGMSIYVFDHLVP